MMFEPIVPITNVASDWKNSIDKEYYQNDRCFALFKQGKTGVPYYLDAIVWRDEKGHTYTGSAITKDGETVYSRQYVKKFPFEPKTFVVDVIGEETSPGDWTFRVKDESQLEDVFKYYKKYEK